MSLDVAALRAQFPALQHGDVAYFDGPGGTQTARAVADAIAATLTAPLSNKGDLLAPQRNAVAAVAAFRSAFADLTGAATGAVVHARSATTATYDLARTMAKGWGPGDEVVVTRLDHDANIRPWVQAAGSVGATVRWVDVDPTTADLDPASAREAIGERTRLLALPGASNLLGTIPDVPRLAAAAHAVGAHVHVDAVHLAAHELIDVAALGADTLVCSPYKFFGPHCGVLAAADPAVLEALQPDKLVPSTDDVPERFELGTLPYEVLAGAAAAVDVIAGMAETGDTAGEDGQTAKGSDRRSRVAASWAAVGRREAEVRARLEEGLRGLGERVIAHSVATRRTPTLLLTFASTPAAEVSRRLAGRGVLAPAGSFYAIECSRRLGLGDEGGLRVGLAAYTSDEDVARLLEGLADAVS